jgi:hypothetical protein
MAEPASAADLNLPSGWTKAANLEGRFMNELVGLAPADWDCPPADDNFTVTDSRALIRGGAPGFKSTGKTIPAGTFVVVTEKSAPAAGSFVRVCEATIAGGKAVPGVEIGWTAAANLKDGCGKFYGQPAWADQRGANACWRAGKFIGAKLLVNIVGVGGEMEQITLESLEPYFRLRNEAAKKNLDLGIESGFRTYERQAELFRLYQAGKGNLAASPGKSNHQHGQAFDLNTRGFDGDPMYDWLKKNAPKYGFIRTVNKEHWHWEYRPADAAKIAEQGGFALAGIRK